MTASSRSTSWYTPIQQTDFKALLKGKQFAIFQGQLIFEKGGQLYVTRIDAQAGGFTTADYRELPEGAPFELINGKLTYMPSPKEIHQQVSINLSSLLHAHVRAHRLGIVRAAPLDVHLSNENIFQPDIFFIAENRRQIVKEYIYGAPDLVIEILSPGTSEYDGGEKRAVYGRYGVREYWLIDPYARTLVMYRNENGELVVSHSYSREEVTSEVLPGFRFLLEDIFSE